MTKTDLEILTNFLHSLYGEKFPLLTPGMAQLWYEELQPLDAALVTRAAKRWARHHTLKAPTLDELLEQVEWLREADRKARLPQPVGPQTPMAALVAQAARTPTRSAEDLRYVRAMQVLYDLLTGPAPRWTRAQCAAACQGWATQLQATAPRLAADLVKARRYFDTEAAQRGEAPAPPLTGLSLPSLGEGQGVVPVPAWEEPCLHETLNDLGACNDCGEVLEPAVAD